MTIIDFSNVTVEVNNQKLVSNTNLQIAAGSFVIFVGESGSGKTTLLDLCADLRVPTSGHVSFPHWKNRPKEQIAYMRQEKNTPANRTAFQNVARGLLQDANIIRRLLNKPSFSNYVRVMDYLEKVGLLHLKDRRFDQLSGGEKRRIELASTLIQNKSVYLFDEPISGLDPKTAEQIMHELARVHREQAYTIICAMSQLDIAKRYATHLITHRAGMWHSEYFPG